MATYHGKVGAVYSGTYKIAEVTEWSYDEDCRAQEDTELGDTAGTETPGIKIGSGRISCWWDPTDTNGQVTLREGETVSLHLYPEGFVSQKTDFNGSVLIKRMSLSGGTQSMEKAEFEFGGVLAEGTKP